MLCKQLSSYAETSMPDCFSQEACFQESEKNFFSSNDALKFQHPLNQKLVEWLNLNARAWLYFNQAESKLREINRICSDAESDFSRLPLLVDEFNAFMLQTAKDIDEANALSISIILLQSEWLEESRIDLIKEESLFQNFISFQSNLNAIKSKKQTEKNFINTYIKNAEAFQALVNKTGFSKGYAHEKSFFDLFPSTTSTILNSMDKESFMFPFISNALQSFVSLVYSSNKTSESLSLLNKVPSFSFFSSIDSLAGTKNSSNKEFAVLIKSTAQNTDSLKQKSEELEKEITSLISVNESMLAELSIDEALLDLNFVSSLFIGLNEKTSIAFQGFKFNELSFLKQKLADELERIQKEFSLLKGKARSLALGEKISRLKQLRTDLNELSNNISFASTELLEGIESLCNNKLALIEESLPDINSGNSELSFIKKSIEKSITEFNASNNQKIVYCRKAVNAFTALKQSLENYLVFEQQSIESSKDCLGFLEKVFSAEMDFSFLENEFIELKARKPFLKSFELNEKCYGLKEKTISFVKSKKEVKEIETMFSELSSLFNALRIGPESDEAKAFNLIKNFFPGNSFDLTKLGKIDSVFQAIELLMQRLSLKLAGYFEAEHPGLVRISQLSAFYSDGKSSASYLLEIENPFASINQAFSIKIPFPSDSIILSGKPSSLAFIRPVSGFMEIGFKTLPKGITAIEFSSADLIQSSSKLELLHASMREAFFARKLFMKALLSINNPQIELFLADEAIDESSVIVIHENKKVSFELRNSVVSFILPEINGEAQASVFFSVKNPVSYEIKAVGEKAEQGIKTITYSIEARNELSQELELQVVIPLSIPSDAVLLDESNKKINHALSQDSFSFQAGFLPKQKKNYFISFQSENKAFFNELFLKARLLLDALKESENTGIKLDAEKLLNELSLIKENDLASLQSIQLNAGKLKERHDMILIDFSGYLIEKQSFVDSLSDANKSINLLSKTGFEEDALKLSNELSNAIKAFELIERKAIEDPGQALKELTALKALLSIDSSKPGKALLNERNSLKDKVGMLEEKPLQNELNELLDASLQDILSNDLLEAKKKINAVALDLGELDENNSAFQRTNALNSFNAIEAKVNALNEEKINKKLKVMESMLKPAVVEELKQFNYLPSFTEQKINYLKEALQNINIKQAVKNFSSLKKLIEKESFKEAASFIEMFFPDLDEKTKEFNLIDSETDFDLNNLKQEALQNYASSAGLIEGNTSTESKKLLFSAKKALDKEDYLSAILFSLKAKNAVNEESVVLPVTGFLALPEAGIPLAIIPLALAFAFILFWRHKKKKEESQALIQRVLRHY